MDEQIINPVQQTSTPVSGVPSLPPQAPSRLPLILMTILFLLATSAAIYFYFNPMPRQEANQLTSSPTPVASVDPASDWQVYSNPSYNFSFKYPLNYTVQERVKGFLVLFKEGESVAQAGISFDMRNSPPKSSFESIVKELYDTMNISKTYTVQAGDNSWSVYEGEGKEGMIQGMKFVKAVILQNSKLISVETIATSEYRENFDQILSTFKFTDLPAPTPNITIPMPDK